MKPTAQWISLGLAAFFGAVMLVAFLIFPGFFPPMSPNWSAQHVADFYAHHATLIRTSMVIFNLCGLMLVPFFMVIVYQMKRMATPTQVLAYCYLSAAVSGFTLFAIADLMWLIAAFRPMRDPQLVMLLNDFAWIIFTAPVGAIVAQNICLAIAVRLDARPVPVFPKWVAPFSLLIAAAMVPACCGAIVHNGPLAWNGLVSFWLRIIAYGVYFAVMFVVLMKAIRREAAETA
ncbi:MAG TPA: hypothetical protein VHD81_01340 [Mycobacteriales bacterium]|nr:hypothetical protein [Mycobacteriales bacterium]